MPFHPGTGCAVLGCRRAQCVHEPCWGADVPPEQTRSRQRLPAPWHWVLRRAGPARGCTESAQSRAAPDEKGGALPTAPGRGRHPSLPLPRPPRAAAPPPAPRRTLACLFRVGGATGPSGGRGLLTPPPGVGVACGPCAPAMLWTRRACGGAWLLRAARGPEPGRSASGARGQGWLQPTGYDTGVKVYNSLTRRKDPLIVSRADAASW